MKVDQNNKIIIRSATKINREQSSQVENFADNLKEILALEKKKEISKIKSNNLPTLPFSLIAEGRKKGKQLLDGLRNIQLALLGNSYSKNELLQLKQFIGTFEDIQFSDGLKNVLEEIELRVAVEIAKLEQEYN